MSKETNTELIYKFIESGDYNITKDGHIYSKATGAEIGYEKGGYKAVSYMSNGKKHRLLIHRIVFAKHSGIKLDNKLSLNHKDGNKFNNSIDNLEQVTQAENNLHAFRVLKRPAVYGHCKITKEQAEQIRYLRGKGWKYEDLMKEFKVGKTTISYVINNKIWN